ncbi:hypothetical protein CHMI_03385 [Cellulomonas hominis]|nr:hypothetical protein CHMI_03385 [Cellulomonas hominis]
MLPTVLRVIGDHARRRVAEELPAEDPYLRPGQILVAHVGGAPDAPRGAAVEGPPPPGPARA